MNQVPQAPAHLQGNRRQVAAASVQGMGTLPTPYISIGDGNHFTLVDAQGVEMPWQAFGPLPYVTPQGAQAQGLYLDAVVVDVNEHMSKSYYVDAWNPNAQKYLPPVCWSDNGLTPSVNATQPQSPTCEHCPHNVWGSKVNQLGNQVKACDDLKKIAWYIPELGMEIVFLMRLKGSSHKNWRAYVEKVRKNSVLGRPADPVDVVTRIFFQPQQIGILNFEMVGFIDADTAAIEDRIWQEKSTDALVGRNDQPRALAAPVVQVQLNAPATYTPPPPQTQVARQEQPLTQAQQDAARLAVLEAELSRLKGVPAATPAPTFGQPAPQARPPAPTQPAAQNNAPAGRPAGFGASPLPQGSAATQPTAQNPSFGGQSARTATTASAPPATVTASPSDPTLPPSGRPGRKPRPPREPAAQAVNQPPQTQQTGAAPQPPQPNAGNGAPPQPQNFGIAHGEPINADLDAALNAALGT